MWALTWIANWTPDFVIHSIVGLGVLGLLASFFLGHILIVQAYKTPIQVISIMLLIFGLWFEGFNSNNKIWEEKVRDLEQQVSVAEKKASDANTKIEYIYVDRIKVVRDTQVQTIKQIQKDASLIDKQCNISAEVVDILNSAALNPVSKK